MKLYTILIKLSDRLIQSRLYKKTNYIILNLYKISYLPVKDNLWKYTRFLDKIMYADDNDSKNVNGNTSTDGHNKDGSFWVYWPDRGAVFLDEDRLSPVSWTVWCDQKRW